MPFKLSLINNLLKYKSFLSDKYLFSYPVVELFLRKTGLPIILVAIKKEKGFSLFDLLSPKGRVKVSISLPIFPSSKDDVIKLNKKILASFYNMGGNDSGKK